MTRIAVFASGRGTNFENLIKSDLPCMEITLLVTDTFCNALEIAKEHGVEARTFLRKEYRTKEAMEQEIASLLVEKQIDLIVLAGYMRLFSPWFVKAFPKQIINIHPSLLPLYKGMHAIEQAITDGRKLYGVSVHYVNEGMDEGEVIAQAKIDYDGEILEELEQLVHQAEYELYPRVIRELYGKKEIV